MHYHAQTGRPFFLGCYTNADASTTLDQCRAFYAACGRAADIVTITTVHGSGQYNKWCPCFDTLTQSNVKAGAAPYYTRPAFLEAVAAATSSPSPQPSPPPLSSPPASLQVPLLVGATAGAFAGGATGILLVAYLVHRKMRATPPAAPKDKPWSGQLPVTAELPVSVAPC